MTRSLKGKVAVVTGAASGVGFGIAQEFLDAEAKVVVVDLDQAQVDAAVAKLGPESSGYVADVSKSAEMEAMYAEVDNRYGRLDAVIANAGVGVHAPLGKITEEAFDQTFNVNAKGVLFTVQPALPYLKSGGTVVVIGSTATIQPPAAMSMYGGSKAAIRAFIRTWVQDVRGTGIRMNVLSPGAVDTESLRRATEQAAGPEGVDALLSKLGEQNPMGRISAPREIGKAAVFLSSDDSSFITGIELFVDGGLAQI
jgi:NAD(P)-dependent dehydrogenase (short-subunit alcohol dehydrogenase family)